MRKIIADLAPAGRVANEVVARFTDIGLPWASCLICFIKRCKGCTQQLLGTFSTLLNWQIRAWASLDWVGSVPCTGVWVHANELIRYHSLAGTNHWWNYSWGALLACLWVGLTWNGAGLLTLGAPTGLLHCKPWLCRLEFGACLKNLAGDTVVSWPWPCDHGPIRSAPAPPYYVSLHCSQGLWPGGSLQAFSCPCTSQPCPWAVPPQQWLAGVVAMAHGACQPVRTLQTGDTFHNL